MMVKLVSAPVVAVIRAVPAIVALNGVVAWP